MIDLNHITAYLAFCGSIPIGYAYLRIAASDSPIVRHMAVSLFCVVSAYACRSFFWDIVPAYAVDTWPSIIASVGGTAINAVWNGCFLYGCIRGLMALHLMVPKAERPDWPVWRAWLYPPWRRIRVTRRD